ncbi:GNAT family N-acetyltransferase [Thioalbus denitrificans]|uniref:N-acetylglutamate synthase-like GNAT family acetyltransferase n=1 Tax=Thioalbus denitrificans TaxID=547122 RepID=A0A369CC32_9GAMM|nr:GNAT family N-acetyltransferase [Thioalbus denitrificans]RCX30768.1 N-acetylglutamate synthase-like GNAT family acetyltransferase [Thioalbus denitrificans]
MNIGEITLRRASADDLAAINRVIEAAIMGWQLPERVKRLSLPAYRYAVHDLENLVVGEAAERGIVAVAAWEPAGPVDAPAGMQALLLHGLYVLPPCQGSGLGSRLLVAAERRAREGGFDGLLVKAQAEAAGFFAARGMVRLAVENPRRDYARRYWKRV